MTGTLTGRVTLVIAEKAADQVQPVDSLESAIPTTEEVASRDPAHLGRVQASLRRSYRLAPYETLEVHVEATVPCLAQDVEEAAVELGEVVVAAVSQLVTNAQANPLLIARTAAS